ncbi:hypothetical protein [Erythrobacter longus]|nr:hypothetical protein [Erythrobacter longus]
MKLVLTASSRKVIRRTQEVGLANVKKHGPSMRNSHICRRYLAALWILGWANELSFSAVSNTQELLRDQAQVTDWAEIMVMESMKLGLLFLAERLRHPLGQKLILHIERMLTFDKPIAAMRGFGSRT